MKRRALFIAILMVGMIKVESQETFNIRDRYDFLACVLTSVVPTDSCYYVAGVIADTTPPYRTGSIFIKLDLQGTPLSIKTIKGNEESFESWHSTLMQIEEGSFFNVGDSYDSITTTFLAKYNAFGDTLFTQRYLSPYLPVANFIKPWGGATLMPDGGVAILCWIYTLDTPIDNDANYYLIRTDSLGNKIWGKIYATPKWERPQSIVTTPGGSIICGGVRTNQTTNVQNLTFQCHIFQVDSLGNSEWEYLSPISAGLRDAANDMLLLDDGSIIVASGIGHEQQHASVNEVYFDRLVFKLNPQHQIEWELTFPDSALTGWARTKKLIKLSDGSGYIMAGMIYNSQPPPKYFTVRGWLSKISTAGDSIWTRRYAFLVDGENEHEIYDVRETSDGGLIICGESFDWDDDANYPQQGWLLKLDEYGCLVPGCQLSDATDEVQATKIKLSIYPNPTTDYLNFLINAPNPASRATIRIINGEGKLVKEFKTDSFNSTFIVPVWDWASGVYWVQVMVEGKLITTEKFIKQ
ncbi:MAG: T9SS type A sorting domain-containing protein [Saprospiraceae bacterium]|nr:T9SS type A sorting domain-containing protein [Saprospiraceae bacterium]MCF8252547.1 T9SS type A sorting domain-containing protein [Saprospiraceae bacterium]MCF8282588.1 T9SS type A sorting domain-containing protein [Bacteroidales bacterium]MCF8310794.1 T9SS type A sorting domain-containing protein [Saprospiraceae bacterium]MCF8439376.1 T9SS type A sorting domain-containing protein [Saprospiraceae bacterium]